MSRFRAAVGSFVFLLVAPGVMAGLIPWLLTDWSSNDWPIPLRVIGAALIAAGLGLVLPAFARFAIDGGGTPAPVAPTERLVVTGAYRYVRNPMYLGVAALIVGQSLLLGQAVLLAYAAIFVGVVTAFVLSYEEPTLARTYGQQYEAYRSAVPRWIPRLRRYRLR
jgi:protein-S-isoprenylcysteine O-methyltransferase Ste14